jgi:transposase
MRTMLKNSVHGQFLKLGVVFEEECSDMFSIKGRGILERHPFAAADRAELERRLSAMDDLSKRIGEMDKLILAKLKEDPRAELLLSLPGFGRLTAYGVLAEAGDFKRFPNRRALASYAGLLPVPDDSAGEEGERQTAKRCNRFLRWALIEAVSGAIRESPRMRSLHARVKARNPKRPGMARVAVARELAELAHLLIGRDQKYIENPAGRPGSQEVRRATPRRPRMSAAVAGAAK